MILLYDRLGQVKDFKYTIELDDLSPVKQQPYHMTREKQKELDMYIDELIEQVVVVPVETFPFTSPAFLMTNPDKIKLLVVT